MQEKEIYIIRHGQTDHNKKGIVQGKGINLPLNETGQAQASLFYAAYKDVPFEVVYTSTLIRAQETVAPFLALGLRHEVRAELDEISWGDMEGKNDVMEGSTIFKKLLADWESGYLYAKPNGGESPKDVQLRQLPFIAEIKKSTASKILVCMHGRAMRVLLCSLTDTPLEKMKDFEHANLTLYKIRITNNTTFVIELFNHQDHLHAL